MTAWSLWLRERLGYSMPVTRFSEFVIVADLIAMDRTIADVVFKSDLRHSARLRVNHLQMHGLPDKFHPSR